jgi:hypothetical protein
VLGHKNGGAGVAYTISFLRTTPEQTLLEMNVNV